MEKNIAFSFMDQLNKKKKELANVTLDLKKDSFSFSFRTKLWGQKYALEREINEIQKKINEEEKQNGTPITRFYRENLEDIDNDIKEKEEKIKNLESSHRSLDKRIMKNNRAYLNELREDTMSELQIVGSELKELYEERVRNIDASKKNPIINKMKKSYLSQKLHDNIILEPKHLYLSNAEANNNIQQNPVNQKIIDGIIDYKQKVSKKELRYHYLVKADIFTAHKQNVTFIQELSTATKEEKVYKLLKKSDENPTVKTFGMMSDNNDLTKEYLCQTHQYAAILWDMWKRLIDDYDGVLVAIIVKSVSLIPEVQFDKIKCKAREPLHMKLLSEVEIEVQKTVNNNGLCALQHILDCIITVDMFKKYTMPILMEEFKDINCEPEDGVSVEDIHNWIKKYGREYLSCIALDIFGNGRTEYKAEDPKICIIFFVYDRHIYGVHDEDLRKPIISKGELSQVNFRDNVMKRYTYINMVDVFNDTDFGYISSELSIEHFNNNIKTIDTKLYEKILKYYINRPDDVSPYSAYKYEKMIHGKVDDKYSIIINKGDFYLETIYKIMKDITNSTQTLVNPFKMKLSKSNVTRFEHPISGNLFEMSNGQQELMQEYCDKLFTDYGLSEFKYNNKSIGVVNEIVFKYENGYIEKSDYTQNDINIIDTYYPRALMQTFKQVNYHESDCKAIDIRKAYTNILLNNKGEYMIFNKAYGVTVKFDNELHKDIPLGYYLVDSFEMYGIQMHKQLRTSKQVKYLLKNGLNMDKIILVRKAYKSIKPEIFSDFVKLLLTKFGDMSHPLFKDSINFFIGSFLGTRYMKSEKVFTTSDFTTFCEAYHHYSKIDNVEFSSSQVGEFFCGKISTKKRLLKDNFPIYMSIICDCQTEMLELAKSMIDKMTVVYVKTDCIGFMKKDFNDKTEIVIDETKYKFDEWKPLKLNDLNQIKEYDYEVIDPNIQWTQVPINFDETGKCLNMDEIMKSSKLINGMAGCGKSFLLNKIADTNTQENTLVLTANNKAAAVCRLGCKNVYTFDKFNCKHRYGIPSHYTMILVDEVYTSKAKWISYLYKLKLKYPKLIIMGFGEMAQCKAIQNYINYDNSVLFHKLFDGNRIDLIYNTKTGRYEENLYKVLDEFKKTGELDNQFNCVDDKLKLNICYLNSTKDKINKNFMNTKDTNYNGHYKAGTPVISIINDAEKKIYKNETFIIQEVKDNTAILFGQNVDHKYTKPAYDGQYVDLKNFEPFYACTVFKIQGTTILEDYNILDTEKMNLNELYVAMSRAKNLSQIHMNYIEQKKETYNEIIGSDNSFESSSTRYYLVDYNDKEKHANIVIKKGQSIGTELVKVKNGDSENVIKYAKFDKQDHQLTLEYVCIFEDSFDTSKKFDIIKNDLVRQLQSQDYKVSCGDEKFTKKIQKTQLGQYQDKIKKKVAIHEYENEFVIKCILPNGKTFRFKRRFQPLSNRKEVYEIMVNKRNEILKEHYMIDDKL